MIDLGTGDGLFVYHSARETPTRFFIGIDPSPRPLEKISEKIHRKPSRGGAPNALFVQASVENLPSELDGVAREVRVHFPWGSLLRAVAAGDPAALAGIRRMSATGASLEVVIGFDPERDATELARLGIEPLTLTQIDTVLAPRYRSAGFAITGHRMVAAVDQARIRTSWAQRLRANERRTVVSLTAIAT